MRGLVAEVGQRLMVGFQGLEASAEIRGLFREFAVGHVILFARNVAEPEQVAGLVAELQEAARGAGQQWPLLIAVDQEGGRIQRLREPWTVWPSLRALGRSGSQDLARRMGAGLAAELKACGIGWDLAPVVDVDTNPRNPIIGDRSLGDEPELVGSLGAALVQGLQEGGVAACAKHFPGHGDTDLDSHLALPVVDHSRSRLDEVELPPFRRAIAAGVAGVMTAHALIRELDGERPATLSPAVVTGLLRQELGFGGVTLADDLEMKAVAERWRPGEAAVLAAGAGCDVIPVCADHDAQVEAAEGLIRALESGALPSKGHEDAVARVRRMKERYLAGHRDPEPRLAREAAGTPERWALAREIAERGGVPA